MRNLFYSLIAIFLVCCASSSTKNEYAKTIGDYLQTDKRGTKYDLKFKVIELNEHGKITVADSIAFLTGEFKKDQQLIIKRLELAKSMSEDLIKKEKNWIKPNQNTIDKYTAEIKTIEHRIDSLRNAPPTNLNGYDRRKAEDVLALIIRCKYSLVPPHLTTTIEETSDFYLSPDGKKCYSKARVKK